MVHASFCCKHLEKKSKEVIKKPKILCRVRDEREFKKMLEELEKILNEPATELLKGEMADKCKWALAHV